MESPYHKHKDTGKERESELERERERKKDREGVARKKKRGERSFVAVVVPTIYQSLLPWKRSASLDVV